MARIERNARCLDELLDVAHQRRLSTADRREDKDPGFVAHPCVQTVEEPDTLVIHKNVDVGPEGSALVDNPVEYRGRFGAQVVECSADGSASRVERDGRPAVYVDAERPGEFEADHVEVGDAAFTQTIGGRPPASCCQLDPSSLDPNSFPLRVPK